MLEEAHDWAVQKLRQSSLPITFLAGGMEDSVSPWIMLETDKRRYLLAERRNDDGEWDVLVFAAPDELTPVDTDAIKAHLDTIGEYAEDLGEIEVSGQVLQSAGPELSDLLWDLFFGYRDVLAPGAVS